MRCCYTDRASSASKQLQNIYEGKELERDATVSKMETVQNEGGRTLKRSSRWQNFFNLPVNIVEHELDKDSVTEKFSVTAADGKNDRTQCYNLDAIIKKQDAAYISEFDRQMKKYLKGETGGNE